MLGSLYCDLIAEAPLLPKLRGHFAEFLNKDSPARLRIFFSSTCVGLRYGPLNPYLAAFLASVDSSASLLFFTPSCPNAPRMRTSLHPTPDHYRIYPLTRSDYPSVSLLHFSESRWCRNLYLLSIIYAFRPQLRSRLTLGGRTFPRKPQTFDGEVSRLSLATYAGILSSIQSTAASATASARIHCSSTNTIISYSQASVTGFSPDNFRRIITRPVSYYALFKCVAASKPTSWLFMQWHILYHLTCTSGP